MAGTHLPATALQSPTKCRCNNLQKLFATLCKKYLQKTLVMSRSALLYVLDEPIGGVDPAARDYILNTILTNYNENGTILISTHLISDIEQILDDVILLKQGKVVQTSSVDDLRNEKGMSIDSLFREVFKC